MTYYQLQEYIKLVDSIMDSKGMNTARQKLHDKINYIKKKMKPKKEQIQGMMILKTAKTFEEFVQIMMMRGDVMLCTDILEELYQQQ